MYRVIIKQFINVINLEIFIGFCLFVMIARKMEQKTNEPKKNIDQRFEAKSGMIKSVVHDVCALLIENFKIIFKEEKRKNQMKR